MNKEEVNKLIKHLVGRGVWVIKYSWVDIPGVHNSLSIPCEPYKTKITAVHVAQRENGEVQISFLESNRGDIVYMGSDNVFMHKADAYKVWRTKLKETNTSEYLMNNVERFQEYIQRLTNRLEKLTRRARNLAIEAEKA